MATTRTAALVTVLALALAACFGDGADDIQAQARGEADTRAELPPWLEKVYPPPGSETSATQAVQVNHNIVAADQQVRLLIDGVDVTTYAVATSPGLLEYDIDQAAAPVPVQPGVHRATVQLFNVTPGAGEGVESFDPDVHDVVDVYEWQFTVL